MGRRSYPVQLMVNGRLIQEVIIDSHYETKHPQMNDPLILELVSTLDGRDFQPEERENEWEFFMLDHIEHRGKFFRLVWCMKDGESFIGVINAFRR